MSRYAKTPEQFAAEMAVLAPSVEILEPYKNAREKILCRCKTCGGEWMGLPNHLLRGTGCPWCSGRRRIEAPEFLARVQAELPNVELLSDYVNARTRVQCRCRICGHEWSTLPRALKQGYSCPACSRANRANRSAAEKPAQKPAGGAFPSLPTLPSPPQPLRSSPPIPPSPRTILHPVCA